MGVSTLGGPLAVLDGVAVAGEPIALIWSGSGVLWCCSTAVPGTRWRVGEGGVRQNAVRSLHVVLSCLAVWTVRVSTGTLAALPHCDRPGRRITGSRMATQL